MTNTSATVAAVLAPVTALATKHLVAEKLRTLAFGVELEFVGRSRETVAKAVARCFPGSTIERGSDYYKSFYVVMADGRKWRIMSDASVTGSNGAQGTPTWTALAGELVSPILGWSDMDDLQRVVRAVRKAGATVDASCGMHVHVDGRTLTTSHVANLATDVANYDGFLDTGLGIAADRRARWCKRLPDAVVAQIRAVAATPGLGDATARDTSALVDAWYGAYGGSYARTEHYNRSRYHGLNLHSLFLRGTVEFRHFNGSLHAGEIRANICLALGFVARAMVAGRVTPGAGWERKPVAKRHYCASNWCTAHGLGGAEFTNVRAHLTRRVTNQPELADAA